MIVTKKVMTLILIIYLITSPKFIDDDQINYDEDTPGTSNLTVHLKPRNKKSEVLIIVVTRTMSSYSTVVDMLLLTIVLAVDMSGLVADQSIDGVYVDELGCVLGVVVAEFLYVVQYRLSKKEEVMLQVEMLGHGNK